MPHPLKSTNKILSFRFHKKKDILILVLPIGATPCQRPHYGYRLCHDNIKRKKAIGCGDNFMGRR